MVVDADHSTIQRWLSKTSEKLGKRVKDTAIQNNDKNM